MLLTGACTSGGPGRTPIPTRPPRSSATLRLGYPQEPATLDPLGAGGASSATRDVLRPLLPSLFSLDAKLRPQPDLALHWPRPDEFAFDPFSVKLALRNATWSDGVPITASDVRFSWEKLRAGPTGYRYHALKDVTVVDPQHLVLRFTSVQRRWWSLFSIDDMVLPQHAYGDAWNRAPTVSGGPFVFQEWTPGLRIRLVRNERYWGPRAPLAGIDVVFVPDDETRFQLMDERQLDAFFSEGDSNVGRRARARGYAVGGGRLADGGASGAFGPTWWELDLDPQRLGPPVAKAVLEAAHPSLAAEIVEDSGLPLNSIQPDFGSSARDPFAPWKGRGSLPEAKAVLDQANVPGTQTRAEFQLVFPRDGATSAIAAFIHFRLQLIGITAELVGLRPDTFEREWASSRKAEAMLRLRRGADAPDADAYAARSKLLGSAPVDADVDLAEGRIARDKLTQGPVTGVALEPWNAVQRELASSASAAPLASSRTWLIARRGVQGPQAVGASNGPLWNAGTWAMTP